MNTYIKDLNRDTFEHKNDSSYLDSFSRGLSKDLIKNISKDKNEPKWMLKKRLEAFDIFEKSKMPKFGPYISNLDFEKIVYYAKASDIEKKDDWGEIPDDIKKTFDRLGIPEAERKVLAGVGAQYESEVVYHSLKKEWADKGVLFEDFDVAVQKYPEMVKKYFGKCVPPNDHKFAALHFAVFSGGTFLYIPKGVRLDMPVQAYFRMNAPGMGQFEHTLIIVEEGAEVQYIEGCSAPKYGERALHAGCVEIFVGENARMRYSSVENWSEDTYNLNTKRSFVEKNGRIEWVGGNLGSGITMLYPCSVLRGEGASCEHLGIAFANRGQIQDVGAKVIHAASNTSSNVLSKSISKGGGVSIYRGLLHVLPHAKNVIATIDCDALILDEKSQSDTFPDIKVYNKEVTVSHEAKVGKINDEDLFYLMSRGTNEEQAKALIVNGFFEDVVKELPLEYAVELNKLIEMEMEGSVG